MKAYSNQADNLIRNLKPGSAVLIYGPDNGAAKELQQKFINKIAPDKDAMGVKEFSADAIKDDPSSLLDEIAARSFFAESRVISINFAATITDNIVDALENIPDDLTIIIAAGELDKASKIRKFFEAHKSFPAIACYKEDERTIRASISQKFRDAGVRVDVDAMNFLATNLGEDKGITNNEIQKILLYLGEQKTLAYEEVVELMADSSELTLNDITNSIAQRDVKRLEKSLTRAFAEHMNAMPILRSVSWQFQRLASARMMAQNGMGIDAALQALRPPLYGKQQDQFKASLNKWNAPQLKKALAAITKAELEAKSSTLDSDMVCRNALLKLAAA